MAVRLDYGAHDVRLTVVNGLPTAASGQGHGPAHGTRIGGPGTITGGYGLTGMQERLRLLNGTLAAGPGDGQWAVTAELPLAPAGAGCPQVVTGAPRPQYTPRSGANGFNGVPRRCAWSSPTTRPASARAWSCCSAGCPGIDVVGAAADGQQALDLVAEHQPDAILLDLHMPVLDGIGATRRLTAEHPGVAIVVLTTYVDDSSVLDALRAGARSYLTKDADRTDIARALQAAAGGLTVFDPRVHDMLLAAAAAPARPDPSSRAVPGPRLPPA